jgi:IrrE N-terminal-like domain
MRDFDDRQEDEADWLAGSLLVSEVALKRAKSAGWTHAQTARHLGASENLVRWRWNMSGIDRYIRGPAVRHANATETLTQTMIDMYLDLRECSVVATGEVEPVYEPYIQSPRWSLRA